MSIPGIAFAGTAAQAGLVILGQRNGPVPRSIGGIVAQVTVEEIHHDALTITEHPVEQGATISDHAFKRPAEVIIRAGWSNSPSPKSTGLLALPGNVITSLGQTLAAFGSAPGEIQNVYANLLLLQESRQLFKIVTGKRTYDSMLLATLSVSTDRHTENSLIVSATCKQVIIVSTQVITVPPRGVMATPEKNAATEDTGTKQTTNASSDAGGSVAEPTAATNSSPSEYNSSDETTDAGRPSPAERDASYAKAQAEPGYRQYDRIDDFGNNRSLAARNGTLVIGARGN